MIKHLFLFIFFVTAILEIAGNININNAAVKKAYHWDGCR